MTRGLTWKIPTWKIPNLVPPPTKRNTAPLSFRLDEGSVDLLDVLIDHLGMTKSNVVRLALRRLARSEQVGPYKDAAFRDGED